MAEEPITLISPTAGLSQHTCGYCSPPGERSAASTSISYGVFPRQMSCRVYQKCIDRGWRRSGKYMYKPDMGRTCCPQYTIRLDATEFKASKSQRKSLTKWNKFVLEGRQLEDVEMNGQSSSKPKHKGRDNAPFSLIPSIHASEASHLPSDAPAPAHRFEVRLELASYTDEKFALYSDYQANVHLDEDCTPAGFKTFLVHSPLLAQDIPYPSPPPAHLPRQYGSYHQLYILDGELIAMSVLDILPLCVSSVYFMYASGYDEWSMGKVSALREAALAKEMHDAGLADVRYLYMGYYIYSCQKMRYKGDYSPSFLLDPEDYIWHSIQICIPLLETRRYVSFAHADETTGRQEQIQAALEPEPESADGLGYRPLPPATAGCLDPTTLPYSDALDDVDIVVGEEDNNVVVGSVTRCRAWRSRPIRRMICDAVAAFGLEIAGQIILTLS